jgi:hypothetical protein
MGLELSKIVGRIVCVCLFACVFAVPQGGRQKKEVQERARESYRVAYFVVPCGFEVENVILVCAPGGNDSR